MKDPVIGDEGLNLGQKLREVMFNLFDKDFEVFNMKCKM